MACFCRCFVSSFNFEKVDYILANQSCLSKLNFELWDNKESSKENCGGNLSSHVYVAL